MQVNETRVGIVGVILVMVATDVEDRPAQTCAQKIEIAGWRSPQEITRSISRQRARSKCSYRSGSTLSEIVSTFISRSGKY